MQHRWLVILWWWFACSAGDIWRSRYDVSMRNVLSNFSYAKLKAAPHRLFMKWLHRDFSYFASLSAASPGGSNATHVSSEPALNFCLKTVDRLLFRSYNGKGETRVDSSVPIRRLLHEVRWSSVIISATLGVRNAVALLEAQCKKPFAVSHRLCVIFI